MALPPPARLMCVCDNNLPVCELWELRDGERVLNRIICASGPSQLLFHQQKYFANAGIYTHLHVSVIGSTLPTRLFR